MLSTASMACAHDYLHEQPLAGVVAIEGSRAHELGAQHALPPLGVLLQTRVHGCLQALHHAPHVCQGCTARPLLQSVLTASPQSEHQPPSLLSLWYCKKLSSSAPEAKSQGASSVYGT